MNSDAPGRIDALRRRHGAVIMAHNYCVAEVQDLADFTGDSLQLSIAARDMRAETIVFCGVRFMAETAKIVSPDSLVLLPVGDAGCPMADMAPAAAVAEYRRLHPDHILVAYVNSTAETKAQADVCVTSANAEKIVAALPADRPVMFLPDRNLGANVARALGRRIELWPGFCPVHDRVTADEARAVRAAHPGACFMCHPECRPEVCALADAALATGGMLRRAREGGEREFIVCTENGIMHRMRGDSPDGTFVTLDPPLVCGDMKKIAVSDVLRALESLDAPKPGDGFAVELDAGIIERARRPIERMIELSGG